MADQKGKLWAGTNRGLSCIDLDSLYTSGKCIIRFVDEEDGYTGQSSKKAVIDAGGNLWIAADDQLIRFDTKIFLTNQVQSGKIILKSIDINHIPVDSILKKHLDPWTSLPLDKTKLKHSENNLIFYYDILNYNNPEKDRFRYILRGYDKNWSNWGEGRKAVYTNLAPGKYSFCVESYNLRTFGQAERLIFEFTILHPWWGLWYLQVVAVSLLLTVVVLITRQYTETIRNKKQKKLEIEKTIVELEMQALQAQMNPHFIFNCVNGIQYYVLANKMDEVLVYLSYFSKVLRESLANATLRVVPLEQEIDFLHSYLKLEQMRFPDKFAYDIRCFDSGEYGNVLIPPMLVQPFAENAIRHGFMHLKKKGSMTIVFEKAGIDLIKCSITDNGIGRDKARLKETSIKNDDRPHSGVITETRIRLFNRLDSPDKYKIVYTDLTKNGMPCGLKVEIYLPMEKGLIAD